MPEYAPPRDSLVSLEVILFRRIGKSFSLKTCEGMSSSQATATNTSLAVMWMSKPEWKRVGVKRFDG